MKNLIIWHEVKMFFLGLLCTTFIASNVLAMSETPEKTLAWCEKVATEASEMAFKAQVTCDYSTVNQAYNLADEAAYLAGEVSRAVENTANKQLALSAYNVCHQVEAAIAKVIMAAQYIVTHSPNPDEVHAADVLLDYCKVTQKENQASMEMALAPFSNISERAEAYSE